MGKGPRVEQFFDERRALGVQLASLARGRFNRRAKILLGGLVSEEQPEEPHSRLGTAEMYRTDHRQRRLNRLVRRSILDYRCR